MTRRISKYPAVQGSKPVWWRDESGSAIVELGLILPVFLLLFFGLIDFGRLTFHFVTSQKAMQVAARVAAVRPPACAGVPEFLGRGPADLVPAPEFGTSCRAGTGICANPGIVECSGSASNPTAEEIWNIVRGTLPNNAAIGNLTFVYSSDPQLGFLGGPYTPIVTVELDDVDFEFISPLGDLVGLAGGTAPSGLGANIRFPSMSVSLPAEDLAAGNNG